jgi:dGTPase
MPMVMAPAVPTRSACKTVESPSHSARSCAIPASERTAQSMLDTEVPVHRAGAAAIEPLIECCKHFAKENLYTSADILKLEIRGRRVIHDLMDIFWESVESLLRESLPHTTKTYPGKIYNLISENYRRVFEKRLRDDPLNQKYYKAQLVTDYIAGMTDPFACRLHNDLTNG